jgi:hypothetical protein
MDEKYRLVFRGEVLEGQHRAVVKRRLTELMKLSEPQADKLFSGDAVVVKSDVDRETAARYQTLFRQAGGRLQVLTERTRAGASPMPDSPAEPAELAVIANYAPPPDGPTPEIEAPDYDIAAVGTNLLDAADVAPVVVPMPDFELAEVGVDLLTERTQPMVVVQVAEVDFDVAERGATLGPVSTEPVPDAPDVSHLKIVES